MKSNKEFYSKKYEHFLGDDVAEFIKSFNYVRSMRDKTIRFNSLKISEEEFLEEMDSERISVEKLDIPFAYHAKANFSLGSTVSFLQGHYYVQSYPSQLSVSLLGLKEGDAVLDAASSPGGKTTLISQYMKNTGMIIALEKFSHRFASLKANLQRMGTKNVALLQFDALTFTTDMKFDAILVDAPCSGNFFAEKDWFSRDINVSENARIQRRMLDNLAKLAKKGTSLVYSTCSLEPEEDELVADYFLEKHPDFVLSDTGYEGHNALYIEELGHAEEIKEKCIRFWPHLHNEEGFFIAKFIKTKD